MYFLPNVEIAYQPNTKNIFSISYSSNNNFPSIKNLLYEFSFTQFLSLKNGSTNLKIGRTNTFLLSYTYLDLLRNGILLSIGSFYNQIYEPYITASSSSGSYLIQKELINEDKLLGNNIAVYGYAEKLIKPIKSPIKLNTSYYAGES
jgi:outer membrane receptor protein involved in Fe transport